jgi:flagellar motor switch protein FliN/FliY
MTNAVEGTAPVRAAASATRRREGERGSQAGRAPTAQRIALPEFADGAAANGDALLPRDLNPLHQVKARLQACVGEATVTVGELLAAQENQVLRLDRMIDQPIDLTIEGKVVARGQLVAVDDHFAVKITQLPVSLSLTPAAPEV